MGVWDSMGQGVQAGINAYLERLRQQKEGTQNQALIDLRQKELGLNQANAVREQDLIADAQARAEQEKRVGGYKKLSDFSDPSKGIFVYEYEELSPGAYVPVPRDEQMRRYQEQFEQYQTREKKMAEEAMYRDIAVAKARPAAEKPVPDDTQTLLMQLYDKSGRLNTAIATSLFTRVLQAGLPAGMPVNPVDMLRGQEGVRRAQDIATYLGSAASSYHPGRDVQKDLLTFLAQMNPDLSKFLNPPLPPAPPAPRPPTGPASPFPVPSGLPGAGSPTPSMQPLQVRDETGRTMSWDWPTSKWVYRD